MSFRRMKKLLRAQRERILSLVLLPAFFLGTLPHTACICSDGHREEFCQTAACHFFGNSPTARAHGDCCSLHKPPPQRSCCAAQRHHAVPVNPDSPGGIGQAVTCCHPFVEAPAPTSILKHNDEAKQIAAALAADVAAPTTVALPFEPAAARFDRPDTPLDLVIVLQRLTI